MLLDDFARNRESIHFHTSLSHLSSERPRIVHTLELGAFVPRPKINAGTFQAQASAGHMRNDISILSPQLEPHIHTHLFVLFYLAIAIRSSARPSRPWHSILDGPSRSPTTSSNSHNLHKSSGPSTPHRSNNNSSPSHHRHKLSMANLAQQPNHPPSSAMPSPRNRNEPTRHNLRTR